ncbi:MAG: LppM family (lipo)protein [Mycobacteriaceae bacterium]
MQLIDTRPKKPTLPTALMVPLLLVALLLTLSGCVRVKVTMGVSANDRVSGQILAAITSTDKDERGPQLQAPNGLGSRVSVRPYQQEGFIGSQAIFSDLSFSEVTQLGSMSTDSAGRFDLSLRRSGELVTLEGRVDLSQLKAQNADIQFSVAFPARISTTNGTRSSETTVAWKLTPGEITTMNAAVRYSDPNTRSFAGWAGLIGGITLGFAGLVALLAWYSRDRSPKIRQPKTQPKP